ncbi:AMP-binding protein [Pseudonocardia kujensis]|uniref:AMP-dependent synthetase/ligase n=1 Tax=Pseudonocardia kujensis TaxID=1128675 RepID=UPI001E495D7E|nr:AMP-binding protein [Pseudonocardia kujensis]MCE0767004.1 AMP-binding protein [Pseudonocardia kujensis]
MELTETELTEFEPTRTLPGLLLDRARSEPEAVAMRYWRDGNAQAVTWRTYRDRVRDAALGLAENGVRHGDRVAVMSSARPEWIYAALAVQSVGGVVIGVYPTNSRAEIEQLLVHSEAVGFVGESSTELDKVAAVAARTPALRLVVGIDAAPTGLPDSVTGTTWDELSSAGAHHGGEPADRLEELVEATTLDDPAVLFYTSGSTGAPKGVAHSHRTLQHAVQTIIGLYPGMETRRHDMVGFLPLAHVAPALLLIFTPLLTRLVATYCRMQDYEQVVRAVRPTALLWPPRFYEKTAGELIARAESWRGIRRHAYRAAMGIGRRMAERRWSGRRSLVLQLAYLAALRGMFLPLRATVGMDRIRVAWTASAAMPENLMALWQIWGLDLRENYGLTETAGCPVGQFDQPFPRPGRIGREFPDSRYRVEIAPDGEMLLRAPLLFREYWHNPEETDAVLQDGWFRTGDLVERTEHGDIRLIGRKKDVIITSGGKTINPQPVETRLKESSLINEAIIVGDGRKYLTVLLEPSALAIGLNPAALSERLRTEVEQVNADLARVQQLKAFRVLPRALETARGERTANGKIRRNVVVRSFSSLVDEMYGANDDFVIAEHVRSRSS